MLPCGLRKSFALEVRGRFFCVSMRTVSWQNSAVEMIDQRLLPGRFEVIAYRDYREVAGAITTMVVRGAPAIGAAGAFGLALAAQQSPARDRDGLLIDLEQAKKLLDAARPTAINLSWATNRPIDPYLAVALVVGFTPVFFIFGILDYLADEDVEI